MSALPSTAVHAIPAPLEVIPKGMADAGATLLAKVDGIVITDHESLKVANALLTELHQLEKDEAEQYRKVKGPVTQLAKAIDQIHNSFSHPIVAGKDALKGTIRTYEQKAAVERQEALWKAMEVKRLAEEAAEKERKRLQDIVDAKHTQKVADLKAKADREAQELADLLGTPVEARAVVEPAKEVVEAPKVQVPAIVVPVAPAVPSPMTVRRQQKVRIIDARKVAAVYAIGLHTFVSINEKEVEVALKMGCPVDGAELYWDQTTVMKGSK